VTLSSTELLVGVDVGTTDTKAVLTTMGGVTLGYARRATTWRRTSSGRLESTAAAFTDGVLATLRDLLDGYAQRTGARAAVRGLGIAGLAESGVVLDGHGDETSPVIAWFDDRGAAELGATDPEVVASFSARTGLPVGAQWSLAKLLWLRGRGLHLDAASRWLNVPELIAYSLTGQQVSEPSLASRTALVDQSTSRPWAQVLAVLGVGEAFLPDSVPAGQEAGRVTACPAVPELVGAVVTVAGHDHPVAAVGAGAAGPQDVFNSCGTAEVLLRSVPRVLDEGERSVLVGLGIDAGAHVLPGHTALIGGMRSGLVMNRVLAMLGATSPPAKAALDQGWSPGVGVENVQVTGASIHDSDVTIRLREGVTPEATWAATLDHLATQTEGLLAAIAGVVGDHTNAVAAGGWTRMRSVRESKAAVIARLTFCPVEQPGARGAAVFAACAAGAGRVEELARTFAAGLEPDADQTGVDPATSTRATQHDRSQRENA